MKNDSWTGFSIVMILALVAAAAIGWVLNIVELTHATELNGMAALRIVGIFIAPLGAILGYL